MSLTVPRTLTARLVAVVVLLVVLSAALIGTATTVALRSQLIDRLDGDVRSVLGRPGEDSGRHPWRADGRDARNDRGADERFGMVIADLDGSDSRASTGFVASENGGFDGPAPVELTAAQLAALDDVPIGEVVTVDVPQLGTYRASGTPTGSRTRVAALPMRDINDTVRRLAVLEALATLLGLTAAAAATLFVIRRELAPLREVSDTARRVSELPLATGEIALDERVASRLVDDHTEVGQVASALNAMLDHVEGSLSARHRSEQQVRQFVADASHELRTPLATIAGYTELARRRPETTEQALDKVEGEAQRMTGLVEDLLLLARLDAGRPLARHSVDLTRLLLEAVADARVLSPDHVWRLDLPGEPVEVVGDTDRLHQVVTNLLTNARKHTPSGTTVTVSATRDGFTVRDDGPGFDPDTAERAFERFVRGDAARTRAGGAGLGLSLVQAIVTAHGGEVSLLSQPGDTTVEVRLPKA